MKKPETCESFDKLNFRDCVVLPQQEEIVLSTKKDIFIFQVRAGNDSAVFSLIKNIRGGGGDNILILKSFKSDLIVARFSGVIFVLKNFKTGHFAGSLFGGRYITSPTSPIHSVKKCNTPIKSSSSPPEHEVRGALRNLRNGERLIHMTELRDSLFAVSNTYSIQILDVLKSSFSFRLKFPHQPISRKFFSRQLLCCDGVLFCDGVFFAGCQGLNLLMYTFSITDVSEVTNSILQMKGLQSAAYCFAYRARNNHVFVGCEWGNIFELALTGKPRHPAALACVMKVRDSSVVDRLVLSRNQNYLFSCNRVSEIRVWCLVGECRSRKSVILLKREPGFSFMNPEEVEPESFNPIMALSKSTILYRRRSGKLMSLIIPSFLNQDPVKFEFELLKANLFDIRIVACSSR